MKIGRNDPCPCGSGKKFKKCCLGKDRGVTAGPPANQGLIRAAAPPPAAKPPAAPPAPPPRPRDPAAERAEARWKEFDSQDAEGRIAVFLKTVDDPELMTDEIAFEMLNRLHTDAAPRNERTRFAELVRVLRERQPDVYDEGAHYYLSWCLQDALADGRQDAVGFLARELAPRAGKHLDTVSRSLDALAYHGQLAVLVEVMRLSWPGVKSSSDIFPWAIHEFANEAADYELFDYLEQTASPSPTDSALLDRLRFFVEEPRPEYLSEVINAWTGQGARTWTVDDLALKPPRKRDRMGWDEDEGERHEPDEGAANLSRLITEFVVYLRREEGVPFPRGELIKDALYRYFLRRHEGDLDPRPSMLEQAMHPNRKLPKPPKPAHPLCPERVTFDVQLAELLGFFNALHYKAAALFEVVPGWLRFLESRGLIDADRRQKSIEELRPLHAQLLKIWDSFCEDPSLYRAAQRWPEDAAKAVAGPRV